MHARLRPAEAGRVGASLTAELGQLDGILRRVGQAAIVTLSPRPETSSPPPPLPLLLPPPLPPPRPDEPAFRNNGASQRRVSKVFRSTGNGVAPVRRRCPQEILIEISTRSRGITRGRVRY